MLCMRYAHGECRTLHFRTEFGRRWRRPSGWEKPPAFRVPPFAFCCVCVPAFCKSLAAPHFLAAAQSRPARSHADRLPLLCHPTSGASPSIREAKYSAHRRASGTIPTTSRRLTHDNGASGGTTAAHSVRPPVGHWTCCDSAGYFFFFSFSLLLLLLQGGAPFPAPLFVVRWPRKLRPAALAGAGARAWSFGLKGLEFGLGLPLAGSWAN